MKQQVNFKDKFKRAVTGNFDLSGEDTDRFEAQCGLFGGLTTRLLSMVPPLPERPILDVGCGTGISTKTIIDHVRKEMRVVGVDISPGMIHRAQGKCLKADFHLGDAELLSEITAGPFGGVYYTACIFLFPDVKTSLMQASGIMADGGAVAGSYMETIQGNDGSDLLAFAKETYPHLGIKHKKLFSFEELAETFDGLFRNVVREEVRFKMNREIAEAFYSIPAQSASLFPGEPVHVRLKKIKEVFQLIDTGEYFSVWNLVGGRK